MDEETTARERIPPADPSLKKARDDWRARPSWDNAYEYIRALQRRIEQLEGRDA